jgi:hypothetical protein
MPFSLQKTIEPASSRAAPIPVIRTTLLSDFTMPAAGATAVAEVEASEFFWIGQRVFLASIGWLEIVGGVPPPQS